MLLGNMGKGDGSWRSFGMLAVVMLVEGLSYSIFIPLIPELFRVRDLASNPSLLAIFVILLFSDKTKWWCRCFWYSTKHRKLFQFERRFDHGPHERYPWAQTHVSNLPGTGMALFSDLIALSCYQGVCDYRGRISSCQRRRVIGSYVQACFICVYCLFWLILYCSLINFSLTDDGGITRAVIS
jgi:hypothetical protein